ncbi:MAG: hypothetical protein RMH75_02300 [Archaeoglobaceae archaeon]|nr:hypothetical protein [Archaeoglobaceae archaeon]MDW7989489.1 hypothetical protein [Archaeoglobaceae archaeon]
MMWSYRAIKNPVARKKWLSFISFLILFGFIYSIYRILIGENVIKIFLIFTIFSLFIFLYAIISLGKPRFYLMDDDSIIYKPFKTRFSKISGYSIDEKNLRIKLELKSLNIFSVKTLYFEKPEDLQNAEKWLKKRLRR